MLLGPIIGGALYTLGNGSKEFPFLIMGIPIIIDGIARAIIRGICHISLLKLTTC